MMLRLKRTKWRSKLKNLFVSWGCSSAGRAPRSQRGGRGFESLHLHQETIEPILCGRFFTYHRAYFVTLYCFVTFEMLRCHKMLQRRHYEVFGKCLKNNRTLREVEEC